MIAAYLMLDVTHAANGAAASDARFAFYLIAENQQLLKSTVSLYKFNRKLRYRKEHSASVVLSWCTLGHFSGENLLMAN